MIGIIDYGCGNVGSVQNMFSKIGVWSELFSNPEQINNYSAIVLPGVGTFDKGVEKLKKSGFWDVIDAKVKHDKLPVLGICLGMQLFFEGSREGKEKGFGWIKGEIQKFSSDFDLRIPHMGWSNADFQNEVFKNEWNEFYFVHSYHAPVNLNSELVLAYSSYGEKFPSAVQKENITGFQFHPEKSLKAGMELLHNWAKSIKQV